MKKAILATKVGMTQIFNADGVLTPVTVLQAGPCVVTQIKTVEHDGYSAVQVGYMDKKEKVVTKDANGKKEIRNRHGVTKAEKGHFDKAGVSAKRYVREFKFENAADDNLADAVSYTHLRSDKDFSISMIPHTAKETILSQKKAGDVVNLENDIIGKYVEMCIRYRSMTGADRIRRWALSRRSVRVHGNI